MAAKPLLSLSALALTASCVLAAAPLRAEPLPVDSQAIYSMPPEVLERAFWVCDHTATVNGVDATPIAECTAVFEAMKDTRFGGDFGQLLAWWRENKLVEHTRLEAR